MTNPAAIDCAGDRQVVMPVDDLFLASTFSPRRVRAYATQVEVLGTAPEHVRTLALIDNELVFGTNWH